MAKYTKYSDKDGVWRTIGGRRVFIRTGASLSQAMKDSGKFKTGDRREVQEAKADKRIDKLGKENEKIWKETNNFDNNWYEESGALTKEGKRLSEKRRRNADEMKDLTKIYHMGEYDNPVRADKTYDLVGQHINKDQQLGSISNKAKNMLMNDYNMSEAEADRQINIMKDTKARWEEDSLNRMRHDVRNNVYVHDDGYAEDVPKSLKQLEHERRKEQSKIDRNEFANNMERIEIQKRVDEYDKAILEEKNRNSNDYEYNLYKKARQDENSIDPMTENSTDWEALDRKYRARYEKERADIPEWMEVGSKSVQDKDGFSTDYTLYLNTKNGKMSTVFGDKEIYNVDTGTDMDFDTPEEAWNWFNDYKGFEDEEEDGLLGKMNKDSKMLKTRKDNWSNADVPKVSTQGKSNRKEVSANIQKHIRDYYDSPEEFVSQMEAMKDPSHPTAWSWGQELAKGGNYLIYNSDMADFLSGLKINPKNKAFNDEQVFNNYTALIGRESAKMYENIRKDAVKSLSQRYSGTIDYLKETENMSTSEILELLKKVEK